MKRYWLTLAIAAFAMTGLGAYYVAGAALPPPEFRLETAEGSADEVKDLELIVYFKGWRDGEYASIGTAGTRYEYEISPVRRDFFDARAPYYWTEDIRSLQRAYPGFMRRKSSGAQLYKDEQYVVYAKAQLWLESAEGKPRFVLRGDLLHRASGKATQIRTPVTMEQIYGGAGLIDVQRRDDRLFLLVRLMPKGDRSPGFAASGNTFNISMWEKDEIWAFTVGVTDGKLLEKRNLTEQLQRTEPNWRLVGYNSGGSGSTLVILPARPVSGDENDDESRYYAYAYEEGTLVELPDLRQTGGESALFAYGISGNRLIKVSFDDGKATILNRTLDKIGRPSDNSAPEEAEFVFAPDSRPTAVIRGSKVYLLTRAPDKRVIVFDTATRSKVYEGTIAVDGLPDERQEKLGRLEIATLKFKD